MAEIVWEIPLRKVRIYEEYPNAQGFWARIDLEFESWAKITDRPVLTKVSLDTKDSSLFLKGAHIEE